MTQKDNGGPAFPVHGNDMFGGTVTRSGGMTLRAYAAVHLQQPDSGIEWLDAMILSAKRDAIAGQALANSRTFPEAWSATRDIAELAYKIADAMLAERSK